MSDSIVIIPTYNEKENIENIIRAVFGLEKEFHILVIDDGSPDGTATIVKTLQKEFPERLFIIERAGKQGLGTAYICGFKWCIEHQYDYIFEMDADFSHNPEDLPRLYAAFCRYRETGIPPVRALVMDYTLDEQTWTIDDEYLFCDDLLVAPMTEEEEMRNVYLPEGRWRDYWTGEERESGWHEVRTDRIPVFERI